MNLLSSWSMIGIGAAFIVNSLLFGRSPTENGVLVIAGAVLIVWGAARLIGQEPR